MYEMAIQLRTDSGCCLYEQIYEYIKKEIRDGKLLAGEKLPSTRSLAEYLQVARSTVDYAYGQLLGEGYIESRPCRGYFVCPIEGLFRLSANENSQAKAAPKPRGFGAAYVESGITDKRYQVDFSPYDIDMSGFPFGVWKKITKNILTYANSDLFSRGEVQGDYELRQTIGRYLHSSRGVNCRPEQIIVGAGNDYLLLLLEKILGRHVRIAMENPTYKRSYRIFQSFAYRIVTVDMDESGMRADKLWQANASAAYVMPSHQFPTGTVMPIGRRMELLKWADGEPGRYLIEDDYDSEFRYKGKPLPSLQASDTAGRVIYIGTFSKAIAPAIRISYMVLPYPLLERYRQECGFFSSSVSRIDQTILNEFIRDGYFERYLNKMRKQYRMKHDLLLSEIRPLERHFRVTGGNAGLHVLLTDTRGRSEEELEQAARLQNVRTYRLGEFRLGESSAWDGTEEGGFLTSPTMILGYGGMSMEDIREGINILKKVWS